MLASMFLQKWRRMLTIIISEMLAIIVSSKVGNYNFPKYWQLYFSEILAIIFLEMLATQGYQLFYYSFLKMETDANNYNFQHC